MWTSYALGCAEKCGRAEEVTDALHHVIRFYPDLSSTQEIKAVLDQWETQRPPVSEVSQQ